MVSKTKRLLRSMRARPEIKQPIATDMFIPNHSGITSHPEFKAHTHTLDTIENPVENTDFTMANKTLKFTYQAPTPAVDTGAFEIEARGGFSGSLIHIHQHTGNPGAGTKLIEAEAEDVNVCVLDLTSAGENFSMTGAALDMNTQKIVGVVDPTTDQEVATKKYVDDNGGGASDLDGLDDATITDPAKNQRLIYNGTNWVNVAEDTTFEFSINTFTDNQSSLQLIGSGVWKAAGAITFTASYTNGPPTGTPYVSHSGWSNLDMTSAGEGPTNSDEAENYAGSVGTKTWTLHATDGEDPDTQNVYVTFYNYMSYGITSKTDTFTEADIEGLANQEISNDNTQVWDSVTTGSGEYMLFAFPTRLGTPTFWVGGFEGGFESSETVSVTNSAGFTENYYAWRSTNSNLGATVVETK